MDLLRDLTFRARGALPWSAPALKRSVPLADAAALLSDAGRARLADLSARYDLAPWERCCALQDHRESLYVLDLLDTALPADLPEGRCLDVGSKSGAYLPGLATAVRRGWDAVEIDAHRRYLWGATRRAYGEAMAAAFPGCRFVAGDVRDCAGPWAVVTWLLPFLTPAPLAAWGLPDRLLAPDDLLDHVLARLVPGGVLLVINQGPTEHAIQSALFESRGLEARSLDRLHSPLSPFRLPRYGTLYRAPG